jgi:hypothetical protein
LWIIKNNYTTQPKLSNIFFSGTINYKGMSITFTQRGSTTKKGRDSKKRKGEERRSDLVEDIIIVEGD